MDIFHFYTTRLTSSSGTFWIDGRGHLLRFEPSKENSVFYTTEEHVLNPYLPLEQVQVENIATLIIPKGVKSLPKDFMRGFHITEKLSLPSTLESIGNINLENMIEEDNCVFAKCNLPEVVIPMSVNTIGTCAFSNSHIARLVFETTIDIKWSRQFKGCYVDELVIPKEMKDSILLKEMGVGKLTIR